MLVSWAEADSDRKLAFDQGVFKRDLKNLGYRYGWPVVAKLTRQAWSPLWQWAAGRERPSGPSANLVRILAASSPADIKRFLKALDEPHKKSVDKPKTKRYSSAKEVKKLVGTTPEK